MRIKHYNNYVEQKENQIQTIMIIVKCMVNNLHDHAPDNNHFLAYSKIITVMILPVYNIFDEGTYKTQL